MKRTLAVAFLVVLVSTSLAAAAIGRGDGAESFAASFEARAVADPTITACRALPAVQKVDGRYGGTLAFGGEEYELNFTLEALVDRSTGLGAAEGRWQLTDPRTADVVARGELLAAVTSDPPGEASPPDPELELHGLLIGLVEPPGPDMPEQTLLGNFAASLGDGATFPHLKGTVGDPTGLTSNPAVLLPAVKC